MIVKRTFGMARSPIFTSIPAVFYLCSTIFLSLGFPANDPFWTNLDEPWTSKKVWEGIDVPADHSYNE